MMIELFTNLFFILGIIIVLIGGGFSFFSSKEPMRLFVGLVLVLIGVVIALSIVDEYLKQERLTKEAAQDIIHFQKCLEIKLINNDIFIGREPNFNKNLRLNSFEIATSDGVLRLRREHVVQRKEVAPENCANVPAGGGLQ